MIWDIYKVIDLVILPILVTTLISFLIGLERQNIGKDAGLSSHVLVALGACGIAILQRVMFYNDLANIGLGIAVESQRLVAQVLTGVGFIGAGVIMKSEQHIKGITTAATIWIVAVVGIICGSEQILLGLGIGLFAIIFLFARDVSRGINPFKRLEHKNEQEK